MIAYMSITVRNVGEHLSRKLIYSDSVVVISVRIFYLSSF
jgi:hypothetical protein